ncbi:MAG: hypothetical protein RR977_04385 [Oscillospiraceae bacterium]
MRKYSGNLIETIRIREKDVNAVQDSTSLFRCKDCRFFYDDERDTVYRRKHCYFCKRQGVYFSRNYRVGEKGRIEKDDFACTYFRKQTENDK